MRKNRLLSLLMMAAMLATTATFTACSGDKDGTSEKEPDKPDTGEGIKLGEPIGLVYTDFLTPNDVTHNADTTELRISKALADKKGITNFVNRPMGIWDQKEHRAYLRRATEQRLVDDHYVLKVVRSSVAEVTHGQEMALNTGIYYNPTRMVSRSGLTRASEGNPEADKYIDDNNVIHPAAITVQRRVDDGSNAPRRSRMTRGDDGNSATFTIEELYTNPPSGANGWFDWLEDVWDKVVEKTSYNWNDNKKITLLHTNSMISKDIKFNAGPEKGDTISLRFRCPIEFDLDYTLNIRSSGSIATAFVPIPSYLETYIDGYFEANPQLRIGFSKKVTLPKDKERITLFSFSGVGFTFMIGPVPLTIDLDPSVYLKFTSTLMGDAYFGVQYDIATKFKAGVKYDGSWSGIADGEKLKDEFSFINPKVSLRYIGGVGLYFGVDVIIEKVAGPSFNVGPQVMVDAQLSYQIGDDRVNASIEGKAGIGGEAGAKIKIFGFEVAEWHSYFDIGPQWTIFKYPDDGSGSSGSYDPNSGGGGTVKGSLDKLTSDYEAQGEILTGTLGKNVKISIADGATVTLKDVTINGVKAAYNWAGITCNGDATIILEGTNTVRGFDFHYPGIYVPAGHTLTIKGSGSLTASSNGSGAGIGGGYNISCGNIVIEGGTINAIGGSCIAGIGGGYQSSCGNINIKGANVTATGGNYAAGIGGGYYGSCGNITIGAGSVIKATGGDYSPGIGSGHYGSCGNITIADKVTSVTATKGSAGSYSVGSAKNGSCGTVTIGDRVAAVDISPFVYTGGSLAVSSYVAKNGETLRGTYGTEVKLCIADGATVTLDGLTVNGVSSSMYKWAGITCLGNATIILKGTNTVKGFDWDYPGIYVPSGSTLTIKGSGSLTASSNRYGAGIGGGYGMAYGNIVIEGGNITATCPDLASGIGSGHGTASSGGNIIIKGGNITASSWGNAAIGGRVSDITITGGTVNAKGGWDSAGIGGGKYGTCGNITITNGVTSVTATKGGGLANYSIGAGYNCPCGTVTIGGKEGAITTSPYTYKP